MDCKCIFLFVINLQLVSKQFYKIRNFKASYKFSEGVVQQTAELVCLLKG